MSGSNIEKTVLLPAASLIAMTAVSSVYIGHLMFFAATSVRLYMILNGMNGFAAL